MKKSKFLLTTGLGLLSCSLLTSCDYSNFSLFGLFYNIWKNNYVDSLTKGNNNSSNNSNNNSSSTPEEIEDFKPQTYLNITTSETENGKIEKREILSLLTTDHATLTTYEQLISKTDEKDVSTYTSFAMIGDYKRENNVVTFTSMINTYVDRKVANSVNYSIGDNTETRQKNIKTVYNEDTPSFALAKDGSFKAGTTAETGETFTGLSTANTFYLIERTETGRPTDQVLTFFSDNTAYIFSFACDSKNHEAPVSAFTTYTTYKSYPALATEYYDVIRFGLGRGYMYASNNGSNMEFDLTSDQNFTQWYGLNIGKFRSVKLFKKAYTDPVTEDEYEANNFLIMDSEVDEDAPDTPDVPTKEALFELTGKANEKYTLTIYKDNTYKFFDGDHNITEEGTWEYNETDDTLVLTCEDKINIFQANEDGTAYDVDYITKRNSALHQEYSISKEDWDDNFKILLSLKGDKKAEIGLTFFKSGKYRFAYSGTPAKEEGTWEYDGTKDVLTLKISDKTYTSKKNENGTYTLSYVYSANSQLTQEYTISKETWDKTFNRVIATLNGTAQSTTTMTFYSTDEYEFKFIRKDNPDTVLATEKGTYRYDATKDEIVLTCQSHTNTLKKQDDGTYKLAFTFAKNDKLTQDFIMDSYHFSLLAKKTIASAKGNKLNTLSLSFLADGRYTFSGTIQSKEIKETGVYSYDSENDQIKLLCGKTENTLTKEESGNYNIHYVSNISSQLTQDFSFDAQTFNEAFPKTALHVDGPSTKVGAILEFFTNGTFRFGFSVYNKFETGTYRFDSATETILFQCFGKTNTATKQEDGSYKVNYVSNMSSQMTQEFTLTKEQAEALLPIQKEKIEKTNTNGTKFSFTFFTNKTYTFSFDTRNAKESGTFYYDSTNDKFIFNCKGTVNETTKNEDGSYTIQYVSHMSSSLTQEFTLTAKQAASLKA